MVHSHLVAVHELAAEIAVDLMQVEAMPSRYQAHGIKYVRAQLVDVARLSGIVAVYLDASGKLSTLVLRIRPPIVGPASSAC